MIFQILTDNGDTVFKFSHEHYYYIYNQDTETTSVFLNYNHKKIKDIPFSCIIDD